MSESQTVLPPIPSSVFSTLGPLTVEMVKGLKDDEGKDAYGLWLAHERRIKLCAEMHSVCAWQTLWHERVHQICEGAGIRIGTQAQERVCDAIASALVAEMLASRGA